MTHKVIHECISLAEEYRANSAENSISGIGEGNSREDRKRKKKSRWATTSDGTDKTFIPGMPTILPSNLNPDQQEAYLGNYSNFHYLNLDFLTFYLYFLIIIQIVNNIFKNIRPFLRTSINLILHNYSFSFNYFL